MDLLKFPRTRHIRGSHLQSDDLADFKPLAELAGETLIVTEKLDGANVGVSFDRQGVLLLQSRGNYLSGGGRERHFDQLKTWAATHAHLLRPVLAARYVVYGEWLYAKHTVFYDRLPHYFVEFDVFDRERALYLSTEARRELLFGLPIVPAPILYRGDVKRQEDMDALVAASLYKSSDWDKTLAAAAAASNVPPDVAEAQTESSGLAEGVYLRVERDGRVIERYKYVRSGFKQALDASGGHWLDRPIIPNRLAPGVDILASELGSPGAYDDPNAVVV